MRTIWKGAKLEVESVIRETCDKVLNDPNVDEKKRYMRSVGLKLMGEVGGRGVFTSSGNRVTDHVLQPGFRCTAERRRRGSCCSGSKEPDILRIKYSILSAEDDGFSYFYQ
jgi:hypothetical protein